MLKLIYFINQKYQSKCELAAFVLFINMFDFVCTWLTPALLTAGAVEGEMAKDGKKSVALAVGWQ